MATDTTGLFGPTPDEIAQQRQAALQDQSYKFANMDPFQRATAGIFQGGGMLAGAGAKALGMVNPQEQQAQRTQQIMGQGDMDLTSSKGLLAKAEQFRQAGDIRTAMALTLKGKELEKQEQAAALASRKQDFQENQMFELRKDQQQQQADLAREKLQQQAKDAEQRSQDMRYTADQRREAASEATAARLQLGQLMAEIRRMGLEAKTAASANPQLKPGEVVRLRQQMGKDRTAVIQTEADTDSLRSSIGNLVNNDAGLSGITGISGVVPNIPGSKAAEAQSDLESVKGKLMGLGRTLQSQSGGKLGNMAVQEWKIIQDIIQNLDPKAGKDKLKQNLQAAQDYLDGLAGRMRTTYGDVYAPYSDQLETLGLPERAPRSPGGKNAGFGKPMTPAEFNAQWVTLPKGGTLVGPDGKTYTKK